MFYLGLLLDVGMLTQSIAAFYMLDKARTKDCKDFSTRLIVSIISVATLIRVSHIIGIILFCLCCVPCYFCSDTCCVKKRLVSQGSLSK